MTSNAPALECRDVTVRYGDVTALSGVTAAFAQGLIHAVVGQNGAGKTTFARVAAGLVQPAEGEVAIHGQPIRTGQVAAARAAGVELVHQSFALPPSFTVSEAMEFGASGKGSLFSRRGLRRRWRQHLSDLQVIADPAQRIRDLPVESQQGVEIARALITQARVLILDEPTAVLTPLGIETLFARVRRLKASGVTVILILHKIREVLAIADTLSVLRAGCLVDGPRPAAAIDEAELTRLIVGAAGPAPGIQAARPEAGPASAASFSTQTPALELHALHTGADSEGPGLEGVDLRIAPGEILGIAGVEGNGQKALVRAIAGLATVQGGRILLGGQDVGRRPLGARRAAGLRIIPFERNTEGLSLSSSLWENWSAGGLLQRSLLSPVRPDRLRRDCKSALDEWNVRYHSPAQPAGSLSGGNAQKVILAREIDPGARLIIAAQPTRGLDIGATSFVWQALRAARDRGAAVLVISSDLDELFDISDRVAVMLSGRISGRFSPPYSLNAVGAAMTGAATQGEAL
ncbi:simple sugar transport system ATP-binding protein [Pseudooceanicola antarcticus]|uniref:ABC transporter ATP-binding protein n=1 Tax=Pseudooceanicola antarcticus TaxID=1247613 RepID=A0A285JDY2_9RHOB|nr:ATP-binding cassette domain-containing protein [Pseudooceanicola antarcticus]PJE31112.1 ABC transporter ATP-binding protein [Pseudooceanicola antarcticus]SNY58489.1 simple sugar transport system ATP-binding protein [Pseudooceanicola antarcticus]